MAVGFACVGYLLLVGMLIGGLWQPIGQQPPSTTGPQPVGAERPAAEKPRQGPARPVAEKPSPGPGRAHRIVAPRPHEGAER